MYQNLILFDGVCNFCNSAVQMVIGIDRQKIFKFAAIQSELGQQLYRQHGLDPIDIQTLMLVDGERVLTKSDAVLEVLARLDGGWQLLAGFRAMPQPLRDWAYSEFARQRFVLFGRRDACMVPTPELQERFIA
ncbi:thiol-disulfide oxidoreductase DCC family protein [Chamaesiphon sp.]|uniref:thiol-disulfide oxidoreductase DCC family protein n=1 Tax=Chamaesiphon sp. TaxID=2814140 RepID=UPI0035933A73